MSDWMTSDDVRKQVVTQSLASRGTDLREAAKRCRKAYTKDYMSIPMQWLADAYDEAAAILDAKLSEASSVPAPRSEVQSETPVRAEMSNLNDPERALVEKCRSEGFQASAGCNLVDLVRRAGLTLSFRAAQAVPDPIRAALIGINGAIDDYWNDATDSNIKLICYWQFKSREALAVPSARSPAQAPIDRLERAERALAIISYMCCQCGEDAMKMRAIATDVTLWDRPDSMWWYGKDYGPSVPSADREGK